MKKTLWLYTALILTTNHCVAMEVERKSLASFFSVDAFGQNIDANQHIIRHCLSDKKWWYVDQEIQYPKKEKAPCIKQEYERRGDVLFCKTPLRCTFDNVSNVTFDDTDTQIIAFRYLSGFSHYKWSRKDGTFLGEVEHKDFYASYKDSQWFNRLCQFGNNPGDLYSYYDDETEKFLKKKFGQCSRVFVKNDNIACVMISHFSQYISQVSVWDMVQDKELCSLKHQDLINSVECNSKGNEIITTSQDCTMRLWHDVTGQELLRIIYDIPVISACFNALGTEIVLVTNDGKIRVLAQHITNNLQQMLLKNVLNLWLQVKKPSKQIDSPETLLDNVIQLFSHETFCLDRDDLYKTWALFPENMKTAMWRTMQHKIQEYGK